MVWKSKELWYSQNELFYCRGCRCSFRRKSGTLWSEGRRRTMCPGKFCLIPTVDLVFQLGEKAADIEEGINMTYRFLRPPEEYKQLAEACKDAIVRERKNQKMRKSSSRNAPRTLIKTLEINSMRNSDYVISTSSITQNLMIVPTRYNNWSYPLSGYFQLIAKKDDKINCLDTLFNDYDEVSELFQQENESVIQPDVDECVQWDSLQPCIKTQVKTVCGEEPDDWIKVRAERERAFFKLTSYFQQAAIYRRVMCEQQKGRLSRFHSS